MAKTRSKIKDNTPAVLAKSDELVQRNLREAALWVERTVKQPGYCPVDTGTARRSIISNWWKARGSRNINWEGGQVKGKGGHTKTVKPGETTIPSQAEKKAIIGSNIEYFPHIEMGTSKMTARAPLRRALEANWNRIRLLFGAK